MAAQLSDGVGDSTALNELIEKSYQVFKNYTVGKTLDVCKACCITDAEERELVNTPLRLVSRTLLQNSYYESARRYSDQELHEMKHFLPKVLELVADFEFPCHSTEITFTRLDLDQPEKWSSQEIQVLIDFSVAFFKKCLAVYPVPKGEEIAGILIMFGIGHFNLAPILHEWLHAANPESTLHLKDFLVNEVEYKRQNAHKLTNPFSTADVDKCVADWLNNAAVKHIFSRKTQILLTTDNRHFDEETTAQLIWVNELMSS